MSYIIQTIQVRNISALKDLDHAVVMQWRPVICLTCVLVEFLN